MILGIELGSTRIKAVLINKKRRIVQTAVHNWENRLKDGYWTYSLDEVRAGLCDVVSQLDVSKVTAMGISAMMHGYLAFNRNGELLTPFRTWRNTTTEIAAAKLTDLFGFNIPQRWSVAHLYQAIQNGEKHVKDIAFMTTLAGYVHLRLTGEKVLGIGDASGMFPIENGEYNRRFVMQFQELTGINWHEIAPKILKAGQTAGTLTKNGADYLGLPEALIGIPLCPPEGDAGTGMVATNAITPRTGNISAGTSIFAMVVLDKPLENLHTEIDMVTTPAGEHVAMIHCNNCTSDINAWVDLFGEVGEFSYDVFYEKSACCDLDCGDILTYNYYSGEPVTGVANGRPLLIRKPESRFSLANLCGSLLYSAIATLRIGMDILFGENAKIEVMRGHGGFFKHQAGLQAMADSLNVPISTLESAGEGGAFGIALLVDYLSYNSKSLEEFLGDVFTDNELTIVPDKSGIKRFNMYLETYKKGLDIQRKAAELF